MIVRGNNNNGAQPTYADPFLYTKDPISNPKSTAKEDVVFICSSKASVTVWGAWRLLKGVWHVQDLKYILHPEAIESVFVLYRINGDDTLRQSAWEMFTAIQKATETAIGNAAVDDVTMALPKQQNSMESFWLAETLKYFYLVFSPP